jgi:hypothetical protein
MTTVINKRTHNTGLKLRIWLMQYGKNPAKLHTQRIFITEVAIAHPDGRLHAAGVLRKARRDMRGEA